MHGGDKCVLGRPCGVNIPEFVVRMGFSASKLPLLT